MKVLIEKASNSCNENDLEQIIEIDTIDDVLNIIKKSKHPVIIEVPDKLHKDLTLKWYNINPESYDLLLTIYDDWIE